MLELFGKKIPLSSGARILLLAPGTGAAFLVSGLRGEKAAFGWTLLDSATERLGVVKSSLTPSGERPARCVVGSATRLPFKRHAFDAVISFEALVAVRPPWTVLAEFHRVLAPDGTLILFEPQSLGFFSALRDKISGPGKRVFSLAEIKSRLARGDYTVDAIDEFDAVNGLKRPSYCIRAIKRDNPVEPVPQFLTAKEMIERRKKNIPKGEELP